MSTDVLDRIAAANPVPEGQPASAWAAAALLDAIDARRGPMTKVDERMTPPVEPPHRSWRLRLVAAAGAFAVVLAVVGVVAWLAGGDEVIEPGDMPTTTAAPTTTAEPTTTVAPATTVAAPSTTVAPATTVATAAPEDVALAGEFFEAYLEGDWDLARSMTNDPLLLFGENHTAPWDIEVVAMECNATSSVRIVCMSTQVDALTHQVGAWYVYQNEGTIDVVDGTVRRFTSQLQPDPIFDRYDAWIDAEAPGEWDALGCEPGTAGGVPACVAIYLAGVDAWLATDPDLSGVDAALSNFGIVEAFYIGFIEGDWDAAVALATGSTLLAGHDSVGPLWGIDVVDIDCVQPALGTVRCDVTLVDGYTAQISPAYTFGATGVFSLSSGSVTAFRSELDDDPIFERYEAWLAAVAPDEWTDAGCKAGPAAFESACVPVYLANVQAWLATNPDLSELDS